MSPKLPVLKSSDVVTALEKAGFQVKRQTGSHMVLFKPEIRRPVTVPMHPKDIHQGTLRAIIRQSGLTVDEFVALLK